MSKLQNCDNQIICGDCLEVLPVLPKARMIFADPPDNLGIKYDGFEDKWPAEYKYITWLKIVVKTAILHKPSSFWFSYYWKWDFDLKAKLAEMTKPDIQYLYNIKPFVWHYTFGQHQQKDCGSCFRPMLRFSRPDMKWNTDSICEPSARQLLYKDKRADERGRVPGDVWEFPRVCGTFIEKRKWHKNQHPEALIERMVKMSTKEGDLVIDMFAGSGTVNRVCKRLGRKCIGIEISKTYCKMIAKENNVWKDV
jgi:DNA modification methylase